NAPPGVEALRLHYHRARPPYAARATCRPPRGLQPIHASVITPRAPMRADLVVRAAHEPSVRRAAGSTPTARVPPPCDRTPRSSNRWSRCARDVARSLRARVLGPDDPEGRRGEPKVRRLRRPPRRAQTTHASIPLRPTWHRLLCPRTSPPDATRVPVWHPPSTQTDCEARCRAPALPTSSLRRWSPSAPLRRPSRYLRDPRSCPVARRAAHHLHC